jgi:AcrR family transcriptional regulator
MVTIMQKAIRENPAVRGRVLVEALRLFTARGYAATTVREIVAAAGVTKPVLYYYFGSKEGLYLEIMGGISQAFEQRIMELQESAGTVRERLLRFFSGMFAGAQDNLQTVQLAYSIYFGPPQGAPFIDFNRFFDVMLEMVDALLAEGMKNGEIRPVDRSSLAWILVSSHNTIIEEQLCRNPPRKDLDGLLRILNLVLDGVAASPLISAVKEKPQ